MSVRLRAERRSRGRRGALLGVAPIVVVAVAAVTALAYWTATGSGNAGANVGVLAATTVTMHEATGTSVTLQWEAVLPPAPDTVEYYVLRDGGAASASCGSAASPVANLGCTDTVPTTATPTDYVYEVVAVWRSWTSTSDPTDARVKGTQTIVFTSTPPTGATVGAATYEVTGVGGGSGNPVTFSIDPGSASVCSIAGSTVSFAAVGTCTVAASQAGNADYEPAAPAQQSFAVAKGNQVISFGALVDKRFDESVTVAASASSGLVVGFSSVTPAVCVTGGVNGSTVTFVSTGTCTVAADQGGSGNWNAAPQVQRSFQVLKGNQTIAITSTAPSSATAGGMSYTATASASSGLAVMFATGTPAVCVSSGTNGATFDFTAAGTCVVDATQPGNANWNAASPVAQTFSVGKASPTLTVSAPATGTVGTAIAAAAITANLAASSGANATAPITFRVFGPQSTPPTTCASGGTTVGSTTPTGNGSYQSGASFTPSAAGMYWWYVSAPSDANNNAAASACNSSSMTQTVVTAATRLSFSSCTTSAGSSANCATVGTATVTLKKANQGGGTWTARVTLVDGSGNPIVNTTGSAIVVTVSKTDARAVLTFSSGAALTIPAGSTESSNTFTYDNTGVSNGNGGDTVTGSSAGLTSSIGNVDW